MFAKKTRVILDTNTLLLPNQGIDIFTLLNQAINEPYKLCTYQGVLTELEKLAEKKGKDGFAAKLGYIMAKQKDLKILASSSGTHVDDVIVEHSGRKDVIVTQDKGLAKRLREKGVRVLRLRQRQFHYEP